jgi:hypothetical protein
MENRPRGACSSGHSRLTIPLRTTWVGTGLGVMVGVIVGVGFGVWVEVRESVRVGSGVFTVVAVLVGAVFSASCGSCGDTTARQPVIMNMVKTRTINRNVLLYFILHPFEVIHVYSSITSGKH